MEHLTSTLVPEPAAREDGAPAADGSPRTGAARPPRTELAEGLRPLLLDVAVPLGAYYLLHAGFGVGLVTSLAVSSVVPAVRTVLGAVRGRSLNGLAALMLAVNAAGIALSFVTGDPRLMLAKDSGVSSVIGLSLLVSALAGRPLMSAGLKPFVTKGDPARTAAWDRLSAGSARFRRVERTYSIVWGIALLAECVARLVGAFTLPVGTMVWLGTVLLLAAVAAGIVVGGALAQPLETMVRTEAAR